MKCDICEKEFPEDKLKECVNPECYRLFCRDCRGIVPEWVGPACEECC